MNYFYNSSKFTWNVLMFILVSRSLFESCFIIEFWMFMLIVLPFYFVCLFIHFTSFTRAVAQYYLLIACSKLFQLGLDACSLVVLQLSQTVSNSQNRFCQQLLRQQGKLFINFNQSQRFLSKTFCNIHLSIQLALLIIPYLIVFHQTYALVTFVLISFYVSSTIIYVLLPIIFASQLSTRVSFLKSTCIFNFNLH